MLPKTSGYTKRFNETKNMSYLIKDDELLGKFNKIWDKCSNTTKKGFDNEPAHNEKYPKKKKKSVQIFMMMEHQKKVSIAFIY